MCSLPYHAASFPSLIPASPELSDVPIPGPSPILTTLNSPTVTVPCGGPFCEGPLGGVPTDEEVAPDEEGGDDTITVIIMIPSAMAPSPVSATVVAMARLSAAICADRVAMAAPSAIAAAPSATPSESSSACFAF